MLVIILHQQHNPCVFIHYVDDMAFLIFSILGNVLIVACTAVKHDDNVPGVNKPVLTLSGICTSLKLNSYV